jgi:hypothetical protein
MAHGMTPQVARFGGNPATGSVNLPRLSEARAEALVTASLVRGVGYPVSDESMVALPAITRFRGLPSGVFSGM